MAYRVLEQIRKQLHQQFAVASDRQDGVDRLLQLLALLLQRRSVDLDHGAQQVAHIDLGKGRLARAALDLSNAQQSAEDLEDAIDIVAAGIQHCTQGIRVNTGSLRKLEPLPQACQRRAQVVRNVGCDLTQPFHERLDAVQHSVEADGEMIEFIAAVTHRNASLQVSSDDVATGLAHRFNLAQQHRAHGRPTGQREQHYSTQTPQEHRQDHLFHFMKLQCAQPYEQIALWNTNTAPANGRKGGLPVPRLPTPLAD